VPGLARTMLYPAGDGQLHRCRLPVEGEEAGIPGPASRAEGEAGHPDPVVWGIHPPGRGEVFLEDPIWPDEPRLKKWVFVALSHQERRGQRFVYGPWQLWWLELSEGARVIVAAGRLAGTAGEAAHTFDERAPNIAIGPGGEVRLVYLARPARQGGWRLRSAVLEFDGRTGRPLSVVDDRPAPGPDAELATSPLVVTTDGATVFGLSRSGGHSVVPFSIRAALVPGTSSRPDDRAGR
jgi:hypothetical protein